MGGVSKGSAGYQSPGIRIRRSRLAPTGVPSARPPHGRADGSHLMYLAGGLGNTAARDSAAWSAAPAACTLTPAWRAPDHPGTGDRGGRSMGPAIRDHRFGRRGQFPRGAIVTADVTTGRRPGSWMLTPRIPRVTIHNHPQAQLPLRAVRLVRLLIRPSGRLTSPASATVLIKRGRIGESRSARKTAASRAESTRR